MRVSCLPVQAVIGNVLFAILEYVNSGCFVVDCLCSLHLYHYLLFYLCQLLVRQV
jgi:hypothetical protein